MTEQEEIEQLKTVPPRVPLTMRDRVERFVGWFAAALAIAALTLAIIVGASGAATAQCVNDNLGARNQPTVADRAAIDSLFTAQQRFIDSLANDERADQVAKFRALQSAFEVYQHTRATSDRERAQHPIGRC